jgi:hypothetical protein
MGEQGVSTMQNLSSFTAIYDKFDLSQFRSVEKNVRVQYTGNVLILRKTAPDGKTISGTLSCELFDEMGRPPYVELLYHGHVLAIRPLSSGSRYVSTNYRVRENRSIELTAALTAMNAPPNPQLTPLPVTRQGDVWFVEIPMKGGSL